MILLTVNVFTAALNDMFNVYYCKYNIYVKILKSNWKMTEAILEVRSVEDDKISKFVWSVK